MPTDAALLAEAPFFELLDEEERASLASQVEVVSCPAGRTLFEVGDHR